MEASTSTCGEATTSKSQELTTNPVSSIYSQSSPPTSSSARKCRNKLSIAVCISFFLSFIVVIAILNYHKKPPPSTEYVFVNTSLGSVKGLVYKRHKQYVSVFLGIPFAQPPIKDRRFKRPYSVNPWKPSVLEATRQPAACYQLIVGDKQLHWRNPMTGKYHKVFEYLKERHQSEDCLYLNVYVPGKIGSSSKTHKKKPVVIWLHGGAFNINTLESHDPSQIAAVGDVIFVAVSYRLGILGFLHSTDPLEIPGNMGLWDQVKGMKWVHEHINSFGGDPNQITMMGESAGGMSVGFHMMSEHSRHLFKRAILMSGSPLSMCNTGIDSGPLYLEKVARGLGCPMTARKVTGTKYAIFNEKTYECLRNTEVSRLQEIELELLWQRRVFLFKPTVDDNFFPNHSLDFFRSQEYPWYPNHTEIMMGTTGHEGAFFLSAMFPDMFPREGNLPSNLSHSMVKKQMKRVMGGKQVSSTFQDKSNQLAVLATNFYKALVDDKIIEPPQKIAMRYSSWFGDWLFTCPNIMMMNSFLSEESRKVYYYQFNTRPSGVTELPWSKTARHGDELQFVFGYPFTRPQDYTDEERKLSMAIMESWINFIKYGKPDNDWKPCEGEGRQYRDYTTDHKIVMKKGLPPNSCGDIYETMLDYMREKYRYHYW